MSAHTPGPWHLFRDEVNTTDGLTVARIVSFVGEHQPESVSNARLIAAAPDMLEALKAFVEACTSAPPINFIDRIGEAVGPAAAAIAKAEGRS